MNYVVKILQKWADACSVEWLSSRTKVALHHTAVVHALKFRCELMDFF